MGLVSVSVSVRGWARFSLRRSFSLGVRVRAEAGALFRLGYRIKFTDWMSEAARGLCGRGHRRDSEIHTCICACSFYHVMFPTPMHNPTRTPGLIVCLHIRYMWCLLCSVSYGVFPMLCLLCGVSNPYMVYVVSHIWYMWCLLPSKLKP